MVKIKHVLYGGSFNPPTIAHYYISKSIIDYYDVEDFVFLPTGSNYRKDELISGYCRINMLKILCKHLNNARVSDYEINQKEFLGTYHSLKKFKDYYFVIGADNLKEIIKWKNFPDVVKNNKYIVINRTGIDIDMILNGDLKDYRDNFIVFDRFININVSSSEYRKTKNKDLLLEDVYNYIKENGLYR